MFVVRDVADSNVVVCSCPPIRTRADGVKPLPVSRNKSGLAFGFATVVLGLKLVSVVDSTVELTMKKDVFDRAAPTAT